MHQRWAAAMDNAVSQNLAIRGQQAAVSVRPCVAAAVADDRWAWAARPFKGLEGPSRKPGQGKRTGGLLEVGPAARRPNNAHFSRAVCRNARDAWLAELYRPDELFDCRRHLDRRAPGLFRPMGSGGCGSSPHANGGCCAASCACHRSRPMRWPVEQPARASTKNTYPLG